MYTLLPFIVLGFIFGIALGSFIKALADRSLTDKPFTGRSSCTMCKHKLSWMDLFPVFSYLFLHGKCRYCRKKIGREYLIVELTMGFLIALCFGLTFRYFSFDFNLYEMILFYYDLVFKVFVITVLSAIVITDLKKMLIPDRIVLPSILISLCLLISITVFRIWLVFASLSASQLGKYLLPPYNDYFRRQAMAVADPLVWGLIMGFLIGLFFLTLIVITRGRGMGGGDFKLGIFMGIVLGFPNAVVALMLSFLLGSVVGVSLLIAGRKKLGQTIPFGPFLSMGGIIAIFWGRQIMDWYINLS